MQTTEVIILIALTAASAAWAVAQFIVSFLQGDRRRLQSRLSGEPRPDHGQFPRQSVVMDPVRRDAPSFVARSKFLQALAHKLAAANPNADLRRFLLRAGAIGLFLFVMVSMTMGSLLMALLAGVAGAYSPVFMLNRKRARRQRVLADQLADALDFLSRALRAGHSLSTGIQMMGDELPAPIGDEFRRCYAQHSLGQPLEVAMRDMAARVDSPDFAFFVTAVLIQRQTGGDLSEVLGNISGMVRNRIRLQQHVKAITAEGRMTGYILVVFPVILFAVSYCLNSAYAGILLNTDIGRMLLGTALGLQMLGLFVIRKIVTVKV